MRPCIPFSSALLAACVSSFPTKSSPIIDSSTIPRPLKTTIAGVEVVWTPIVQDALKYAKAHGDDTTYKHVVRSWLFGALEIANNPDLTHTDLEVHAVAAILHDVGWDQTPGSEIISTNKRFEVDGAIAARNFIRSHSDGKHWDDRRVQLVWDSIALHPTPSIADYKENEVAAVSLGVLDDFNDHGKYFDQGSYDEIVSEYSQQGLKEGATNKFIWFCQTKPATTYDNWMQPFGEKFVEGYSAVGSRIFDVIAAGA